MGERSLIDYVRRLAAQGSPPWLVLGIGDDAALVDLPSSARLVVTTDSVIHGVHYAAGTPAAMVGRKAIARALSDIAAMAARPLCTVAAAAFGPAEDEGARRDLVRSLHAVADELGAPLVGGDVASTPGPTTVTVTALGTPGPHGAITRAGAQVGDAVCVTGSLGGSIRGRHLTFTPRIAEALALADGCDLHAMIDISDGLSTDALHLAEASGVGIELRADRIPVSDDAHALASETGRPPVAHALNDGEDYELLFCTPREGAERLAAEGIEGAPVTVIGSVVEGAASALIHSDGRREPLTAQGWEHLAP